MAQELIAGRYRLLEPLGRGAMSAVWLAHDEELARRVAVKMLSPTAERERFVREARAVATLSHPNICSLFDFGEHDGRPFMVLEYLPNGSLEDRLRAGVALPAEETHRIATDVAAGLAHAHARGLVHRDLKPANVLFDAEERAKIADFGIARIGGAGTLTEAGTVLGTAAYISPEQASGQTATPASDVYSLGVILFRMLTGRLPFSSGNAMELVRMHRDEPAPDPASVRPDVPARLAAIASAALAKDPADRPADGAALLAELRGGEGAATMLAAATTPYVTDAAAATQVLRPAPAARSRRTMMLGALAAALILLGGGVALALVTSGGGGGGGGPVSTRGLSLASVPTVASTTRTRPTTTALTSTTAPATTTARTTTARTTTAPPPTTTHRTTTIAPPTTTAPPPPPPTTTVAPPTTTAPATTAPATTAPTTTAPTTT